MFELWHQLGNCSYPFYPMLVTYQTFLTKRNWIPSHEWIAVFVPTFQWISKLSGIARCPQNTATARVLHTRLSVILKNINLLVFTVAVFFFYIYAELQLAMTLADSMSFILEIILFLPFPWEFTTRSTVTALRRCFQAQKVQGKGCSAG